MIADFQCTVLDCSDAAELARFYGAVLGGEVNKPDRRWLLSDGWATLHTGSGLILAFQRVADYRPPQWPDPARPQQSHLDLAVSDLDEAEAQVRGLGATLLDAGDGQRSWRVYADPAGHPFCLVRH
ncbi:MAG TPA: VOC family protein [Streptosporangiaceae bacterium]